MLHYVFSIPLFFSTVYSQLLTIGVGVNGNTFTPSSVNAVVGTTITFVWISGSHNVVQTDGDSCTAITPGGFTSGAVIDQPGKKFNITITKPGNIWYMCSTHCATGMKGLITVGNGASTTLPSPTSSPSPTHTNDGQALLSSWEVFCVGIGAIILLL